MESDEDDLYDLSLLSKRTKPVDSSCMSTTSTMARIGSRLSLGRPAVMRPPQFNTYLEKQRNLAVTQSQGVSGTRPTPTPFQSHKDVGGSKSTATSNPNKPQEKPSSQVVNIRTLSQTETCAAFKSSSFNQSKRTGLSFDGMDDSFSKKAKTKNQFCPICDVPAKLLMGSLSAHAAACRSYGKQATGCVHGVWCPSNNLQHFLEYFHSTSSNAIQEESGPNETLSQSATKIDQPLANNVGKTLDKSVTHLDKPHSKPITNINNDFAKSVTNIVKPLATPDAKRVKPPAKSDSNAGKTSTNSISISTSTDVTNHAKTVKQQTIAQNTKRSSKTKRRETLCAERTQSSGIETIRKNGSTGIQSLSLQNKLIPNYCESNEKTISTDCMIVEDSSFLCNDDQRLPSVTCKTKTVTSSVSNTCLRSKVTRDDLLDKYPEHNGNGYLLGSNVKLLPSHSNNNVSNVNLSSKLVLQTQTKEALSEAVKSRNKITNPKSNANILRSKDSGHLEPEGNNTSDVRNSVNHKDGSDSLLAAISDDTSKTASLPFSFSPSILKLNSTSTSNNITLLPTVTEEALIDRDVLTQSNLTKKKIASKMSDNSDDIHSASTELNLGSICSAETLFEEEIQESVVVLEKGAKEKSKSLFLQKKVLRPNVDSRKNNAKHTITSRGERLREKKAQNIVCEMSDFSKRSKNGGHVLDNDDSQQTLSYSTSIPLDKNTKSSKSIEIIENLDSPETIERGETVATNTAVNCTANVEYTHHACTKPVQSAAVKCHCERQDVHNEIRANVSVRVSSTQLAKHSPVKINASVNESGWQAVGIEADANCRVGDVKVELCECSNKLTFNCKVQTNNVRENNRSQGVESKFHSTMEALGIQRSANKGKKQPVQLSILSFLSPTKRGANPDPAVVTKKTRVEQAVPAIQAEPSTEEREREQRLERARKSKAEWMSLMANVITTKPPVRGISYISGASSCSSTSSGSDIAPPSRQCPFYKKIPGTSFAVDAFNFRIIPGISAYFLSHFHYDHYIGLKKTFDMPIYCSPVTASLVQLKIGVNKKYLNALPLSKVTDINGVKVTALDANHCPGSVMFLFQLANNVNILHVGDFRASPEMESNAEFWCLEVDRLFLDTTYCDPKYSFPSQEETLDSIVKHTHHHLARTPKTLIVCGSYTIGKEKVFKVICKNFKCKVWAAPAKRKILRLLEDVDISSILVDDPKRAQVHVTEMKNIKYETLSEMLSQYRQAYSNILAFKPSGWEFSSSQTFKTVTKYNVTIVGVPYSEHSSFTELKRFVQFLKPVHIIPTVNNQHRANRDKMQYHFNQWLAETRTRHATRRS